MSASPIHEPDAQAPAAQPAEAAVAAPAAQPRRSCANCRSPLPDPLPRYCGQCGQDTRLRPPTLLELAQQFGGAYLSTEGALWRTLALLLWPGQLTLAYLAGRRRHYVLPVRLYVTISVVALMALRLGTSIDPALSSNADAKLLGSAKARVDVIDFGEGNWRAGIHDGQFFCEKLPEAMCARLHQRLTTDPQQMKLQLQEGKDRFLGHTGTAMFVLLPLYALWLKLVCLGSGRRYTEHLVFALHLHAFWFALVALAVPLTRIADGATPVLALLATAYPVLAMHRVYRARWWVTALRAFGVTMLHSTALGIALGGVLVATLLM